MTNQLTQGSYSAPDGQGDLPLRTKSSNGAAARGRLYKRFRLPDRPVSGESDATEPETFSAALAPEPPPVDESWLVAVEQALDNEPDATLARARQAMDRNLTAEELRVLIAEVRMTLARPELAEDWLSEKLSASVGPTQLPADFKAAFERWDDAIEIDPADCRYEDGRDKLGWVFNVGWRFLAWHAGLGKVDVHNRTSLSLVADFGTDLYHSKYIANRLRDRASDYVVHLGDVYYSGKQEEFDRSFKPHLAKLSKETQVFCMNANHEMLSGGYPYFSYLAGRRAAGQLQEGSYFCLPSDRFNIVGIDTAYHRDGRHQESRLNSWLAEQLLDGRRRGALNILLSPNEPYTIGNPGLTKLYTNDLAAVAAKGLVDLWFWGNTHYCALFEPSGVTPFIGSCIGHGGFPYARQDESRKQGSATAVRFLETEARFPGWTGLRQDRGNNGFAQLALEHDSGVVQIDYVDWMNRLRHRARVRRGATGPVFVD
jgi:hypothetical protein